MFSSTPREVEETSTKSTTTSKIKKATREFNETPKVENKEKTKMCKYPKICRVENNYSNPNSNFKLV